MSEYTATTENIRDCYVFSTEQHDGENATPVSVANAEFNRWLEAHDAEIRADAWDEGEDAGRRAGYEDARGYHAFGSGCGPDPWDCDCTPVNPYRTPRPPAPELIPGVQAAIDALSIRRKG